MEFDYEYFQQEFFKLSQIDLHLYKEKQMKRRINTLMEKRNIKSYENLICLLKSNNEELDKFIDYITINVTEFFRTKDHWTFLNDKVIKDLISNFDEKLKIWSAGCSSGEEAYSLAMCFLEYLPSEDFEITATDIDAGILQTAERGEYSEKIMGTVPEEYCNKYFTRKGSVYQISEEVKKCVKFEKLNLFSDDYPKDCHLIVCRNVLIYFTEETKTSIFKKFVSSLFKDGYLFLGHTEQIVYYKPLGLQKVKQNFYVKN